jgi:uncharacterized membrane protein YbhN (UPF0104 family)
MHHAMAAPLTGDVNVDFARGMIPHHQGAVEMAKIMLQHGRDPELRKLAQEIVASQEKEIAFLQDWLRRPASNRPASSAAPCARGMRAPKLRVLSPDMTGVRVTNWREFLWPIIGLLAVVVSGWLLYRELRHISLVEIWASLTAIPAHRYALAALSTLVAYAALAWYDRIALLHLGLSHISWLFVSVCSFTTYALSHNIGASVFSGALVRYRAYTAKGLSAAQVAVLVALCSFTFGLGTIFLGGVTLTLDPGILARLEGVLPLRADEPDYRSRHRGSACSASSRSTRPARCCISAPRDQEVQDRVSAPNIMGRQLVAAPLELLGAAGIIYFCLPSHLEPGFIVVLAVFLASFSAALVSHAPGGLGVFELVFLTAMPDIPKPTCSRRSSSFGCSTSSFPSPWRSWSCCCSSAPASPRPGRSAWARPASRRRRGRPGRGSPAKFPGGRAREREAARLRAFHRPRAGAAGVFHPVPLRGLGRAAGLSGAATVVCGRGAEFCRGDRRHRGLSGRSRRDRRGRRPGPLRPGLVPATRCGRRLRPGAEPAAAKNRRDRFRPLDAFFSPALSWTRASRPRSPASTRRRARASTASGSATCRSSCAMPIPRCSPNCGERHPVHRLEPCRDARHRCRSAFPRRAAPAGRRRAHPCA